MTNRCRLHAEPNCTNIRCQHEYEPAEPGMISASNAGAPVVVESAPLAGVFTVDSQQPGPVVS